MKCPRCQGEMAPETVASVVIDRCANCRGVWLDAMETERLHHAAAGESQAASASASREQTMKASTRNCPRCGTPMMTLMMESTPPVYFENCGTCYGVFLDAGELGLVQGAPLEKWLRATIPGVFRLRFPRE